MHVVLVVEDDFDIRATMCEALDESGYTAVPAANGAEALEYLRSDKERPCLILLDLMMPVMDGQTFRAEQLADSELSKIPTVVISAYRDVERYANELSTEFLAKPVRLEQLLETARKHCDVVA